MRRPASSTARTSVVAALAGVGLARPVGIFTADAGPVFGVAGGSGGVGSSTLAAALAATAGARHGAATLIDLDVGGGGVDVLLRLDQAPGARWSGVRLAGGRLDPDELRAGLPGRDDLAVLAADVPDLDPDAIAQVVAAAAACGPVVVDLPRLPGPVRAAGLGACDLLVVLARADVVGLVAAHALVRGLPVGALPVGALPVGALPVGLVLRRGEVDATQAADLVGRPVLGVLPPVGGRAIDPLRPPRALLRVVEGVLGGALDGRGPGRPVAPDRVPGLLVASA